MGVHCFILPLSSIPLSSASFFLLVIGSVRRTERDKKIEKKPLCLIWPPTGNSNTTTNQKHTHATQAVNVRRSDL